MITPINIASGTLISQVCLLFIMALGVAMLDDRDGDYPSQLNLPSHAAVLLTTALVTLGALLLSSSFSGMWRPLVGGMAPNGFADAWVMLVVVVVDVGGLSFLVATTGGSQQSPFQAVYFVLPTLAIFLRQSPGRVLFTTALVSISFSILMASSSDPDGYRNPRHSKNKLAYWFVALSTMTLGLYIGLATRPS